MHRRMRMYAKEHDFSNKCRAFKRVSSGVCKRKGYELAAAAAAGVNSLKREVKLKSVKPGRRWSWMSFGEEGSV